jgi:hypothetical protein
LEVLLAKCDGEAMDATLDWRVKEGHSSVVIAGRGSVAVTTPLWKAGVFWN